MAPWFTDYVTDKVVSFKAKEVKVWNPLTKCAKTGKRLFGKYAVLVKTTEIGGLPPAVCGLVFESNRYYTRESYLLAALKGEFDTQITTGFYI